VTPQKKVAPSLPTKEPVHSIVKKSADTSPQVSGSQQIIARLKAILNLVDTIPIPEGALGADLLEALELTDRVRDRIRARVKELLVAHPHLIAGWHVEQVLILKLCRDKEVNGNRRTTV
jgi:hypothetical protein